MSLLMLILVGPARDRRILDVDLGEREAPSSKSSTALASPTRNLSLLLLLLRHLLPCPRRRKSHVRNLPPREALQVDPSLEVFDVRMIRRGIEPCRIRRGGLTNGSHAS